ncbi:hypothetical protein CRUP_031057 [Coryphaenoides rupestris]|nr:hypothetical protein CRUP_031057 [Coryphaenoides rupestris]
MKPQEGELVMEISKLQCMVSELKSGFSSALLELSQIQHGDSYLREEMEENRRSCQKKARRLETLVETLREELGLLQCQILQLDLNTRMRAQQEDRAPATTQKQRLLLHSYLQGLKAGLSEETDARHQVVMQLLHSEWEYVSTLNHIYDKYKNTPQMLQRHLQFRNTLQERLSAEHWKSLKDQTEREEGKLLSLLLAPVSRIHGYLGHIQHLLQWTGKDHPDCSLLLGSEKVLRETLSRCHTVLEHDVQWEEEEEEAAASANQSGKCSGGAPACASSANCCARSQQCSQAAAREQSRDGQQQQQQPHTAGLAMPCPSMHLECWSCSPVSRKRDRQAQGGGGGGGPSSSSTRDCGISSCLAPPPTLLSPRAPGCLRTPDTPPPTAVWETSDSGQGTSSQPTGRGLDDGEDGDVETDQDDTSAFDYSSVTSCSPDGTLRMGPGDSRTGDDEEEDEDEEEDDDDEEEEDSHIPVLLKPGCKPRRRERTVCLRWQIPRLTPHPPPASSREHLGAGPCSEGPCLIGSYGKRLVSIKKGSPPLHPKSAFRPIWDDPGKQVPVARGFDARPLHLVRVRVVVVLLVVVEEVVSDSTPERDLRKGFVPVPGQGGRHTFQRFSQKKETMRQVGALQQCGSGHVGATRGSGGVWEDSEDSEGPCSTV